MRSRPEWRHAAIVAAVSLAALAPPTHAWQRVEAEPRPGAAEIARALEQVKADPNITPTRTIRMLRWRESSTPSRGGWGWLRYIGDLFRLVAETARVLAWAVIILFASALLFFLVRLVHRRNMPHALDSFIAPSHVRDLDIRPESLPPDIGAAARRLWDRGEHRAALALLYRGLLSRLAHVYRVPIRDSSTEGDCLALASGHVSNERHQYAARLVRLWQSAVYGGQQAETPAVYLLCTEFAPMMDTGAALPEDAPVPGRIA